MSTACMLHPRQQYRGLRHRYEEGVGSFGGSHNRLSHKCASNPIPGLSLLFLHHPYMLHSGIHWNFHLLVSLSFLSAMHSVAMEMVVV